MTADTYESHIDTSTDNSDNASHLLRRRANGAVGVQQERAGGEMARRIREFDWSKTPFGPLEGWPVSLRSITAMMLENRFPMALWWGRELRQIYNDAYMVVLGGKHP